MTDTSKITTRLRPDVDRRLRAAAALQRARLSQVINEALDQALPTLLELGAMVTGAVADAGEEADSDSHA